MENSSVNEDKCQMSIFEENKLVQDQNKSSQTRSIKNEEFIRKQREFLKKIKQDRFSTIINNQNDQNLEELIDQQEIMNKDNNNNQINLLKSSNRPLVKFDLKKSSSTNSRKLLQSIINRSSITKINFSNSKFMDSKDLQEDNLIKLNDNLIDNELNTEKIDKLDDLIDDSKYFKDDSKNSTSNENSANNSNSNSRDGSTCSSRNNSTDNLRNEIQNSKPIAKKQKRKFEKKTSLIKDDLVDEKENLEDKDDLICSSLPTEVLNERERRKSIGYPGLALSSSMFFSNSMLRYKLISNELYNIQNVQLKRVIY